MIYKCWHCGNKKDDPLGICLNCGKFPNDKHLKYINLANELLILQASKNQGRGCSVIREIVMWLNLANIQKAIAVYNWDGDKICGIYPDLDKMICLGLEIEPRYDFEKENWPK